MSSISRAIASMREEDLVFWGCPLISFIHPILGFESFMGWRRILLEDIRSCQVGLATMV
ncbi:unnamed protein product [Hymenolepis diminuta]|uniref:Uncharacterized protein n=1 Tax=Hymenolepis diminuta TaxID=6216 RepID=A0A564Z1L5_HYMDI|nr:unnamed protein product [Hymenolepis diminuta]